MNSARFVSGVASGDPMTTSIVLWAPVEGTSATVTWTIADEHGIVEGTGIVEPDERGVVRAEVGGMRPGAAYRYWFTIDHDTDQDGSNTTAVGRTSTLAELPRSVRLGVACCARWPNGAFTGYRALAEHDVDLVVHPGDYIYEDGDGGERGPHDPPHECTTLDDYDRRYEQYREDPDLSALHAAAPWVATLDDHEIDGNASRFRRPGRLSGPAVEPERRRAGVRAHERWMPQRARQRPHVHHLELHHHGSTVADVDADTIRITDALRPDSFPVTGYRRLRR